jgi:hypothetical protein
MTELVGLLTGTVARHALARRDITAVFRILRDAGVSQTRLARATGATAVGDVRDRLRPSGVVRCSSGADRGRVRSAAGLDGAGARTNLLRHAAAVLYGELVFGPADPIRVIDTPTPVPSRVGAADVHLVAAATERLSQLAGDLGGIPARELATLRSAA